MNLIKVFVYGTLKKGEPNHNVLSETAGNFKFVSEGKTVQKYPLIIATRFNIPFLLNDPEKGHRIQGEVYEVDSEKLVILDELEAYPMLYDRKLETIELKNGSKVEAFVYVLKKWNERIFEGATEMLESYSSKGPHCREYVDRYVRASYMLDDDLGYDLYSEVCGYNPAEVQTRMLTLQKAKRDLLDVDAMTQRDQNCTEP